MAISGLKWKLPYFFPEKQAVRITDTLKNTVYADQAENGVTVHSVTSNENGSFFLCVCFSLLKVKIQHSKIVFMSGKIGCWVKD